GVFSATDWPTPPPTTRLPVGQDTTASPTSPGATDRGLVWIGASDAASSAQIAYTWKLRSVAPKLKTDAYQPSATSPVSVFAVVPVASTGPLDCTQPNGGLAASSCESPPPTARFPAGQSTDAPLTVRGS